MADLSAVERRERLEAAIAERNRLRGHPLTATEQLKNLAAGLADFEPDPELTDEENAGLNAGTHYIAADGSVQPK